MTSRDIAHHFTVDVEEYYQVSALERWVARDSWERLESRVGQSISSLLDLLSESGARGTFFVLGWIAQRQPALVASIVARGHEVASHGWDHRRVVAETPARFRLDVRRSKRVLEDITGHPVVGYRAPSCSITRGHEWALDVLLEEGYRYDSSLIPIWRPGYGYRGGKRDPHWVTRPAGRLLEVPPATLRIGGVNLPAAGGACFRLLPYGLVSGALRQAAGRAVPGTFFIHPWEIDPDQPRFRVPHLTRLRHYGGLHHTMDRLRRLLREFRFQAIVDSRVPDELPRCA